MVWDMRTRKLEKSLDVGAHCEVVFSPDGESVVTAAGGASPHKGQIRMWKVGTWAEVAFMQPLEGAVPAFSPDGKLLVVETGAGVARLLDPRTGSEYASLEDPSLHCAKHFTFSPNSEQLITATSDGQCLHIWDLRALRRRLAEMDLNWKSGDRSK